MSFALLGVEAVVGELPRSEFRLGPGAFLAFEGFGFLQKGFVGERGEGVNAYIGETLGPAAVEQTIEAIRFTPVEAVALEFRLAEFG